MYLDFEFEELDNNFEAEFEQVTEVSDGGFERGYEEAQKEIVPEVDLQAELLSQVADVLEEKVTGYERGKVEGYAEALDDRTDLVVTENGTYEPPEGSSGFKTVSVNVQAESKLVQSVDGSITEITAEDLQGVTKIVAYSFYGRTNILSVVIPSSVVIIESSYAFGSCNKMSSLILSEGLKTIGSMSFYFCSSLTSVVIPESTESIYANAFSWCQRLVSITVKSKTPPRIESTSFANTPLEKIIVPIGSGDAYRQATNWSAYADIIVEGDV